MKLPLVFCAWLLLAWQFAAAEVANTTAKGRIDAINPTAPGQIGINPVDLPPVSAMYVQFAQPSGCAHSGSDLDAFPCPAEQHPSLASIPSI
jgi:hypothetical protein